MSEHAHRDDTGARFGMWLFLFTELLLFGGLFILYSVYLHRFGHEFAEAGKELNVWFGGGNTVVLLTSSMLVALSVTALQRGATVACRRLLLGTVASAVLFLVNKGFEWGAKIGHGIYPGSTHLRELPPGEQVFFNLYYVTTGLHGLHVLIGGLVLSWTLLLIRKGKVNAGHGVFLENAGLYWHLVDLIWIFIFPLYYLILH